MINTIKLKIINEDNAKIIYLPNGYRMSSFVLEELINGKVNFGDEYNIIVKKIDDDYKPLSDNEIIGYAGEYSNCWTFETNDYSYSENVLILIDQILSISSKDLDRFSILITKI